MDQCTAAYADMMSPPAFDQDLNRDPRDHSLDEPSAKRQRMIHRTEQTFDQLLPPRTRSHKDPSYPSETMSAATRSTEGFARPQQTPASDGQRKRKRYNKTLRPLLPQPALASLSMWQAVPGMLPPSMGQRLPDMLQAVHAARPLISKPRAQVPRSLLSIEDHPKTIEPRRPPNAQPSHGMVLPDIVPTRTTRSSRPQLSSNTQPSPIKSVAVKAEEKILPDCGTSNNSATIKSEENHLPDLASPHDQASFTDNLTFKAEGPSGPG